MRHLTLLIFVLSFSASGLAQVTYQRLLQAEQEPENWLTYSGTYDGHRFSRLSHQFDRAVQAENCVRCH